MELFEGQTLAERVAEVDGVARSPRKHWLPRPVTEPVLSRPMTEPALSRPMTEPALSRPVTEPALSRPVTEPVLSRPVTEPALSRPVTKPVLSQPVTKPVLSRPVTKPALSRPMTGLRGRGVRRTRSEMTAAARARVSTNGRVRPLRAKNHETLDDGDDEAGRDILADGTHVHWATSTGYLLRRPRLGGAEEIVAADPLSVTRISFDDQYVCGTSYDATHVSRTPPCQVGRQRRHRCPLDVARLRLPAR
jgi:hypothetical protein